MQHAYQHLPPPWHDHYLALPSPTRRGKQWEPAALRQHLQPLLDAAAGELQGAWAQLGRSLDAASASGGSATVGTGPALRLAVQLVQHLPSPWQLGCRMPQPLVELLWDDYCSHVMYSAAGKAFEAPAAEGGAERLVAAVSEGLTAAPTPAHALRLATALVQHCYLSWEVKDLRPQLAEAALAAARIAASSATSSTGDSQLQHSLLVGALAACAWLLGDGEDGSPVRSEALALLRRCLHRPASLVPLLLDAEACWNLRKAALGIDQADESMPCLPQRRGRLGSAGRPRGRRCRRIALDPSFLH